MFDDLKNKVKDVLETDLTGNKSQNPNGQWINGKWVPNQQNEYDEQALYQQQVQDQMYQQSQQPMQQPMYQQPMQQSVYQQPQQPMQQPMYQQSQQPMQQPMYQQPQQPMQQPMYQQPQQPMQQPMYQQPAEEVESTSPGKWVNGKWVPNGSTPQAGSTQGGLMCPKCKSHNINVQLVEVGSKTKTSKSGVGLGGHAHNAIRAGMAITTLGASNLVIKKATGTEKGKTKTKNQTFCICQNCGHSWKK